MKVYTLETAQTATGQVRKWLYNGIDCLATREIADTLRPLMDPQIKRAYGMQRAAQNPAMAMTLRGILIDEDARAEASKAVTKEAKDLEKAIDALPQVRDIWDGTELVSGACRKSTRKDGRHTWEKGVPDTPERKCVSCGKSRFQRSAFNPHSSDQCKHLLYDLLGIKKYFNKEGKLSTDDDILERMGRKYPKVGELTAKIRDVRGLRKQLTTLNAKLSPDGRYRTEFSVGTAWTMRWSSKDDPFGFGGNVQNIAERHRSMFIPDPGYDLCYADLKQAESNIVAHLAGDEEYIEAHRSGDVHTFVTRLVWPELEWTWDLVQDKAVAKQLPPWDPAPGHDYRFQAKRIQHGGNYGLTPFGVAMIAKIPVAAAQTAAIRYHRAFPGIRVWQRATRVKVEAQEPLVSPLGIRTKLFGRPWDEHTYKQGLSVLPQGTVAHIIDIGVWRIWKEMDPHEVELLAQVHDALLFQYPKGRLDLVKKALELMRVPVPVLGADGKLRVVTIETEAAVGQNWGHFNDKPEKGPLNLNGLKEIDL